MTRSQHTMVLLLALAVLATVMPVPDLVAASQGQKVAPPSALPAQPPPGEQGDPRRLPIAPVERVAPGRFRLGNIEVDNRKKTVSFPAEINMDHGMLEYLLVRMGGKTHESLLRTAIEPLNLQVACLLLGIEGSAAPVPYQGSPQTPTGDPVSVSIVLGDGRRVSPEQWMTQVEAGNKKDVPALKWRFTGSIVKGGRFGAQATGSMIAVYHDPIAIIDHASPGGEVNGSWFVREGAVPAVGTPVTVVINSLK